MMKKILIIAALICLATSQVVKQCPQINSDEDVSCLTNEEPVCGIMYKDNKQVKETFSNHCVACYFGKSNFTVEGECEEFPSDAEFCSPEESKAAACTYEFIPHCGWLDKNIDCVNYPCSVNGGNKCEACLHENVVYTTKDECPEP